MLTDERIIEIRDEHLPNQGESFECIAFARAIAAEVREPMPHPKYEALLRRRDYLIANQNNSHSLRELSAISWAVERHAPNTVNGERCNATHLRNLARDAVFRASARDDAAKVIQSACDEYFREMDFRAPGTLPSWRQAVREVTAKAIRALAGEV